MLYLNGDFYSLPSISIHLHLFTQKAAILNPDIKGKKRNQETRPCKVDTKNNFNWGQKTDVVGCKSSGILPLISAQGNLIYMPPRFPLANYFCAIKKGKDYQTAKGFQRTSSSPNRLLTLKKKGKEKNLTQISGRYKSSSEDGLNKNTVCVFMGGWVCHWNADGCNMDHRERWRRC